jgi:hypothetical protein
MSGRSYERLANLAEVARHNRASVDYLRLARLNYTRAGDHTEARAITEKLRILGAEVHQQDKSESGTPPIYDLVLWFRLAAELSILFCGFFMLTS